MARITVEDCIEHLQNRFELVAIASQRAKDIGCGAPITIDRDNDKNAVVALREIASKNLDIKQLREDLITSLQMRNKVDIIDEENLHAENQELISEDLELSDSDISMLTEESLDFDISSFDDNVVDDDK